MNFISNISNFYFVFLSLYSWRKKSVASNISLCDIGIDPFFLHSKYRQIKDNDKDISNANDRTKIHDSRIILFSFYYFCCAHQASACWAFETIFEQCLSSAEWRAREKWKQTFIVRPHSVWTDSHQHFFSEIRMFTTMITWHHSHYREQFPTQFSATILAICPSGPQSSTCAGGAPTANTLEFWIS